MRKCDKDLRIKIVKSHCFMSVRHYKVKIDKMSKESRLIKLFVLMEICWLI